MKKEENAETVSSHTEMLGTKVARRCTKPRGTSGTVTRDSIRANAASRAAAAANSPRVVADVQPYLAPSSRV